MSGISLRFGDAQVRAALGQAAAAIANPTAMYDNIGAALVVSAQMRFERGVGPDGRAWLPSQRAALEGGQTLVDTGRLQQSLTHNADAGGVEVGTNVLYAAIHQLGGTIKPKAKKALRFQLANGAWVTAGAVTMPARPYLGIDQDDRAEIMAQVADAIGATVTP